MANRRGDTLGQEGRYRRTASPQTGKKQTTTTTQLLSQMAELSRQQQQVQMSQIKAEFGHNVERQTLEKQSGDGSLAIGATGERKKTVDRETHFINSSEKRNCWTVTSTER